MEAKTFNRHYVLLKKRSATIPTPNLYQLSDSLMDKLEQHTGLMAFDYETSDLKWASKDFQVRSVSFHNDDISLAVELTNAQPEVLRRLWSYIARHEMLIAHNATFEAGVTYAKTGVIPNIAACTRGLAFQLAGEGSPGQSWGLKNLAKELLGWDDWSREVDMDNVMSLPWKLLGYYNQVDSAATWELFKLMKDAVDKNKKTWGQYFWEYHQNDFMNLVKLQVETYANGLMVDLDNIARYQAIVDEEIKTKLFEFLNNPEVKEGIQEFNNMAIEEYVTALNKTPKYTKEGKVTKAWERAQDKLSDAQDTQHFNIDSGHHLKWLFYSFMKIVPPKKTKTGAPSVDYDALERIPIYGRLILDYRDSVSTYKFLRALTSNQKDGIIRISIRTPGTITGRCSSGEVE
jgi:hypothetical protein